MKQFLIIPAALLLAGGHVFAQQSASSSTNAALNMQGYLAQLSRWSSFAQTVKKHPERAASILKGLPPLWSLDTKGQHFTVQTAWVKRDLQSIVKDPKQAQRAGDEIDQRLKEMRAEAVALDQTYGVNPALAKARLKDVLARAEFREVRSPAWFEQMRERFLAWLGDFLNRVFGSLHGYGDYGRALLWIVVASLVLVFLILLSRILFKPKADVSLDLKGPLLVARNWRDWARDAQGRAAHGEYREAIRLAYWAGIFRLEELGAWQIHRARTHREYMRLLAAGDARRTPLAALTARFESAWYGGSAVNRNDFDDAILQLERLGCNVSFHPATGTS